MDTGRRRKTTDRIICIFAGSLAGAILVFPAEAAGAALQALELWARVIVPTLCPYLFCMLMLSSHLRLPLWLRLPLCWLCGSPGGAKLLSNPALSREEALRLSAFSGTMSPLFFLSTLSGWLREPKDGILLLACHLSGAVITGLTVKKTTNDRMTAYAPSPVSLSDALRESANAMPGIGVCMMLGSVAARMVRCALPGLPGWAAVLLQCILEISAGSQALIALNPPFLLPFLSAACSFAGFSILMQNAAYWRECGVNLRNLIHLRFRHAAFSFFLAWLYTQSF